MAFPEMKVYCPHQPTRLVNNGTFTKNPKPAAPTFIPLPVPLYAKNAAKVHPNNPSFFSLKLSNCLLTVFTPRSPPTQSSERKQSKGCWWELPTSLLTLILIFNLSCIKCLTKYCKAQTAICKSFINILKRSIFKDYDLLSCLACVKL